MFANLLIFHNRYKDTTRKNEIKLLMQGIGNLPQLTCSRNLPPPNTLPSTLPVKDYEPHTHSLKLRTREIGLELGNFHYLSHHYKIHRYSLILDTLTHHHHLPQSYHKGQQTILSYQLLPLPQQLLQLPMMLNQ